MKALSSGRCVWDQRKSYEGQEAEANKIDFDGRPFLLIHKRSRLDGLRGQFREYFSGKGSRHAQGVKAFV